MARATQEFLDCVYETSLVKSQKKTSGEGCVKGCDNRYVTSKELHVCSVRAGIQGGRHGRLCQPEKQKPPTEKGA